MGKARTKILQEGRARERTLLIAAFWLTQFVFFAEVAGGLFTMSSALQMDALETSDPGPTRFLNRPFSRKTEAHSQVVAAAFAILFGLWTIGVAYWNFRYDHTPSPIIMGVVSMMAAASNAALLFASRTLRKSSSAIYKIWATARNDFLGNLVVLAAAYGVHSTGESWPDAAATFLMFPMVLTNSLKAARSAYVVLR